MERQFDDVRVQPEMTVPVLSGDPQALASLFAKLTKAVLAIEAPLERSGVNEFHKYSYATDADVLIAARTALSTVGLAFFPSVARAQRIDSVTASNKAQTKTYLTFTMVIGDIDTGATLSCRWEGESFDTDDKGTNKAATAAIKYFLLKLLMMPTQDVEDADHTSPRSQIARQKAPRQTAPAQSAPKPANGKSGDGANATQFWAAASALIGAGKRFADKTAVNAWLAAYTAPEGTDWGKALAALTA